MHGLARTSTWEVLSAGNGVASLSLRDNEQTRLQWPHAFLLHLRIEFDADTLKMHLDVVNPSGSAGPFAFEALMHTYISLGDAGVTGARIRGLQGVSFMDKPAGNAMLTQTEQELQLDGEIDRIYMNTPCVKARSLHPTRRALCAT